MRSAELARAVAIAAAGMFVVQHAAVAQWSSDPMVNSPIAVVTGNQTVPKIAATPDGGAWLSWFDNRPPGGGYAVYVQRLDPFGVPQLGANGLLLSNNPQSTSLVDWDLISDSAGNAVVVFTDTRAGGDLDVYAYRVAPDGTNLWGPNGVALSNNNNFEANPRTVETTAGRFSFVWSRTSAAGGSLPGLIMQTLGADGTPQIAGDGIVIAGNPEVPGFFELLPVFGGEVFVSYVRDTRTFSSPRHVRAARYTALGALVWGPALVSGANGVPIAYLPRLASDGANGGVIAWVDGRSGSSNCFVAKVNADGTMPWTADGVPVSIVPGLLRFDPAIAYHAATGDTYVTYNERNGGQSMRAQLAQKFDSAGVAQWSPAGVTLTPFDSVTEGAARAWPVADCAGAGAIFAFTDNPGLNNNRWLAFRVNPDGTFAWPTNPLVFSSPAGVKFRNPLGVVRATGVGMLTWEDQRSDPSSDLYAQNINPDGSLGTFNPAAGGCQGDADCDGMVGLSDLAVVITNWFTGGLVGYLGDFNADGSRGLPDLAIIIGNWGATCP